MFSNILIHDKIEELTISPVAHKTRFLTQNPELEFTNFYPLLTILGRENFFIYEDGY